MTLSAAALESRLAVLDAVERTTAVASRVWVHQADRLAELIAQTPTAWEKGLPAEVGAALSVGEGVARTLLDTAWELRGRPVVRAAVLAGRLNPRQAEVALDELACVDPVVADRILDELLATGGPVVLRPEQLRRWLNRRTLAADPQGARRKRVLAEREESGVRYRALRNGLAQKVTTGPAIEIQKAMRQLDAMTPPVSPEDGRTRGQLLLDTDLGAIAAAADAAGVLPVPIELELEVPVRSGAYALTPITKLPEPVVIRLDLAALAASGLEGLLGTGAAPEAGPAARRPLQLRVRSAVWQRLDALERQRPCRAQHKGGSPEYRLSQLIARHAVLEVRGHHEPGDGDQPDGGTSPTSNRPLRPIAPSSVPMLAGHGPIDLNLVRRHLSDARIRRVLVDPVTGVCAVDAQPLALGDLATATLPMPPPSTTAYAPTADQRRVVRARNQTCTFPGCGCRARRADLDHALAFDRGGETTVANLQPACRFHHQVKQRGWTVKREPDGSSTWTSPAGKTYRTTSGEQ